MFTSVPPDGGRAQFRRHRRAERGQVIPIVGLMVTIIAGFAALTIDTGMGYAQSRNDHDVSDAAALAAAYWVTDNPSTTSGASLLALYQAALTVGNLDGCNTGPCHVPMVSVGASTYADLELWTTAYTSGSSPNFYVNSSGACSATVTGSFAASTCPAVNSVLAVGAPVADTTTNVFSGGIGATATSVTAGAVAQTSGSGTGAPSTNPTLACEICVFQDVTSSGSGNELVAGGGNIDIGGYVWFNTSGDTIQTTNGYGIDVNGLSQYSSSTVYVGGGSDVIEANGNLGIDGNVDFASTGSTVESNQTSKSYINISGTVTNASSNTISPSPYGTTATTTITDPMASVATPTYTGATTSCGSVTVGSGSTSSGCVTVVGSPATSATLASGKYTSLTTQIPTTLNPGEFGSLTIQANTTFNAGTYIVDGGQILINASGVKLTGSGLTFYMTCGSGTSPASCGTWTSSTATCATKTSGASVEFNGSTTLDLSAASGTNNVLFFYDRCNSNADAFYVDSSGVAADSGFPSGMIYAHSGGIFLNAGTNALPSPILVGNITYNSTASVLGTATGSVNLSAAAAGPGNLVQ